MTTGNLEGGWMVVCLTPPGSCALSDMFVGVCTCSGVDRSCERLELGAD